MAIVVLSMIASAAAVGIGLSASAQEDGRLAQLATQAAQQQVSFLLEKPYASMVNYAGTEALGQLQAPPEAGEDERTRVLAGAWSKLSRVTTLTSEPTTFNQYNNFTAEGTRIEVQVKGPDGTIYATIRRHRSKEEPI